MLIVHVHIKVKPECIAEFLSATEENARASIMEPGIIRFDLMVSRDDSNTFILNEIYRTEDDPARHKETDHYRMWKNRVESMMAVPRTSIKYTNIFPSDEEWK